MIKTSRIASGFDVELQLGGDWFLTALNLLNEHGLLAPPDIPVILTGVQISSDPAWHLQIDVVGLPDPVLARVALEETQDSGYELVLTTNLPGVPERRIPFDVLKDLPALPEIVKLSGDGEHEPVMAVLANLDLKIAPQAEEPESEFLPRGDPALAQSFLPLGKHIAFGIGKETYARFANNLWHTELRAEDGTHPLPDADNKMGEWDEVRMTGEDGTLKIILEGDVPIDSPWIDIIPDGHVTITLLLTPTTSEGTLTFKTDSEEDVDTGILGDILAAIIGGLTPIGPLNGIILLEVAEVIVEGIVEQKIQAKINGETVPDVHCCEEDIVQIARTESDGLDLSVLHAIPSSIAVFTQNPDNELLYKESLLVTALYDDVTVNGNGFGAAGSSGTAVKFQPEIASLSSVHYEGEQLVSLTYRRSGGQQQELSREEVLARAGEGELKAPFRVLLQPEDATLRIPEGRLPCVCLKPVAIHREETVVQEIEFEHGLRMRVPDVIALQDAAALVVTGYQLIHPRDDNPYYRAEADSSEENNFESLPRY